MRILVVGSGGREHALTWKLLQSPIVESVFCAPGNGGTARIATNLPFAATNVGAITDAAIEHNIDLVVVGPEAPLALGLADTLRGKGISVFGPSREAARIETSKSWAKEIMRSANVATPRSVTVESVDDALKALDQFDEQVVIKADGLAAGKGVFIAETRQEAELAIHDLLEFRSLGEAGSSILIEEFVTGTEVSVLAITDGKNICTLLPSCDYKRALNGDLGPNTGGMGAYAPAVKLASEDISNIESSILSPVIDAMAATGSPMNGLLYAGLMLTDSGPVVLEFNCRFGDPETEVVLPLMTSDLADLLLQTATGSLDEAEPVTWSDQVAVGVVMVSGGYPESYEIGYPINGFDQVDQDMLVFHAGTAAKDHQILATGGRVLVVVGRGDDFHSARASTYHNLSHIQFTNAFYRTDIAERVASASTE